MHGDLCKHLGKDSSTDHPDRYSNIFLNAYINRHVHANSIVLKAYGMFFYIVLTPISTTSGLEVPAIRINTSKSTYTFTSVSVHSDET